MRTNQTITRILIATLTVTVVALALVLRAAPPVAAAGLRNCAETIGRPAACYEIIWANGIQVRMTFANQQFAGAIPGDKLGNFYVLAPQTATPQGTLPFPHDHVVGADSNFWHAFFVLCSTQGLASGGCVPTMTTIQGLGTIPFARTVNGQLLTSVEPIESAANAGLLTLLDTGGVFVATITPGK